MEWIGVDDFFRRCEPGEFDRLPWDRLTVPDRSTPETMFENRRAARLTPEQRHRAIQARLRAGDAPAAIARDLGITPSRVYQVSAMAKERVGSHGLAGYVRGCRCETCRGAKRQSNHASYLRRCQQARAS